MSWPGGLEKQISAENASGNKAHLVRLDAYICNKTPKFQWHKYGLQHLATIILE